MMTILCDAEGSRLLPLVLLRVKQRSDSDGHLDLASLELVGLGADAS